MHSSKGVTLVELIVVMVIVAIGFTAAVPSFRGMNERNRVVTSTNDMVLAVNLARSEASRTGARVSIIPVTANAANEFGAGYCVVRDNPAPATCSSATDIVRMFNALEGDLTLNSVENAIIEFDPRGALLNQTGHNIDLCSGDVDGRRLRINTIGHIKSYVEEPDPDASPAPLAVNQPCTCADPSPHCP